MAYTVYLNTILLCDTKLLRLNLTNRDALRSENVKKMGQSHGNLGVSPLRQMKLYFLFYSIKDTNY